MVKFVFAIMAFLLLVPSVQAQEMSRDEAVFTAAQARDYGAVKYTFRVGGVSSATEAEALFTDVTDDYIEVFTSQVSSSQTLLSMRTAVVPAVGDESRGFAAFTTDGSNVIEFGAIFVREGSYVYAFFGAGMHGVYLELCDVIMYYFVVADHTAGELPTIDLLPEGFEQQTI